MRFRPEPSAVDLAIEEEHAPLALSNSQTEEKVKELLKCLRLTGENVLRVGDIFSQEMENGINDQPSTLLMENTYIPELLNGTETGDFLALDLGGTNFRILLISLQNENVVREEVMQYHISDDLRLGEGEVLFDYLADCLYDFVHKCGVASRRLVMGFTFSFPMHQRSLNCGVLIKWTKSFAATNVEGQDVVKMLGEAIKRKGGIDVDIIAILNDTTGTLLQGCRLDHECGIGLILGTGSNACYMERAERVSHWEAERHGEKEVIIDIEWGAFGDGGLLDFIRTDFDKQVDTNSLFANSFTFEKYISGKYLGELVRLILVNLANHRLIFNGILSKKMQQIDSFTTNYVSHVEKDNVDNTICETDTVLKGFNLDYNEDDIQVVKYVCEVVSIRAALLVSTCLAEVIKRMNRDSVTVAVDGSLYKHHPRFKHWMLKFVEILAPRHKFQLMLAEDGSGKGAGLAAAVAQRLRDSYCHNSK